MKNNKIPDMVGMDLKVILLFLSGYDIMDTSLDRKNLIELAHYRMPFGKFKGRYLVELPEPYLIWFQQNGFPTGKLGNLLKAMLEIKINGLEGLIWKIQKDFPKD